MDDFYLLQGFRWADGSPLTHHHFLTLKGINRTFIFTRLRTLPSYILHDYSFRQRFLETISHFKWFPEGTAPSRCLVLDIVNLADFLWIAVPCGQKNLRFTLCVVPPKRQQDVLKMSQLPHECKKDHLFKYAKCFHFKWKLSFDKQRTCPEGLHISTVELRKKDYFKFVLYEKSSFVISPIIYQGHQALQTQQFEYDANLNSFVHQTIPTNSKPNGYELCVSLPQYVNAQSQYHKCSDGVLISVSLVCDGIVDCQTDDESDEDETTCHGEEHKECRLPEGTEMACSMLLQRNNGSCALFLSSTSKSPITQASVKTTPFENANSTNYTSQDLETKAVNFRLHNAFTITSQCQPQGLLPCSAGSCFNMSDICVYKLDPENQLIACTNADHLEMCDSFECNAMFKCPRHHCIPWEYLCDGKWDCPRGTDEGHVCSQNRCKHSFKCAKTNQTCVHVGNICDGSSNCPHEDDEMLCELKGISCPTSCECLALAILCTHLKYFYFAHVSSYHAVSFCESLLSTQNLQLFSSAIYLNLFGAKLHDVCTDYTSRNLLKLQVVHSNISRLMSNCFSGLSQLQSLILSFNKIAQLETNTFSNLHMLRILNISHNTLKDLPDHLFSVKTKLKVFSIINNPFVQISHNTFLDISAHEIQTTNFRICCLVSVGAKCLTSKFWFESCSGFLDNTGLEITSHISFVSGIISSCFSVFSHVYTRQHLHISYVSVVIAGSADYILLVIYFCIVFLGHKWGQTLPLKETLWTSSFYCQLAYCSLLSFSLVDPLAKLILAFSRLMVVWYPILTRFKRKHFVMKLICLLLFSTISLSAVATVFLQGAFLENIPNKLCSPFIDPSDKNWVTLFLTSFVFITQVMVLMAITVIHVLLFKAFTDSKTKVQKEGGQKASGVAMKVQFILLTFCAFVCWVPSMTVFLAALFLDRYPVDMTTWTTLTILPLYSVFSSVVLIFAAVRQHFRRNKTVTSGKHVNQTNAFPLAFPSPSGTDCCFAIEDRLSFVVENMDREPSLEPNE